MGRSGGRGHGGGGGGLKALQVNSNVYTESTVNLMLAGNHFHRAVRGITVAYECLTLLTRFRIRVILS